MLILLGNYDKKFFEWFIFKGCHGLRKLVYIDLYAQNSYIQYQDTETVKNQIQHRNLLHNGLAHTFLLKHTKTTELYSQHQLQDIIDMLVDFERMGLFIVDADKKDYFFKKWNL